MTPVAVDQLNCSLLVFASFLKETLFRDHLSDKFTLLHHVSDAAPKLNVTDAASKKIFFQLCRGGGWVYYKNLCEKKFFRRRWVGITGKLSKYYLCLRKKFLDNPCQNSTQTSLHFL